MRFVPRPIILLLFTLTACNSDNAGGRVSPQQVTTPQGASSADPLQEHIFPPELVMQYQGEIRLASEQRARIVNAIQSTQSEMTDMQWKMSAARDSLFAALDADPVDERVVLENADALFALETNVKRKHIRLLVLIRNVLTPAQCTRLRELRGQSR